MSSNDLLSRTQLLQAAMLASFTGKAFQDVKFFAFSRRMRGGIVDQPKSLVANSSLIRKSTSHFDPVLSGGFSESDLIDLDAPYPSSLGQSVDDYGYTSDSDLDSEDGEDLDDQPDSTRLTRSELRKIVGGVIEQLQHLSSTYIVNGTCPPAIDVEGSTLVEGPDIGQLDCNGDPKRRGRVIYLHDIAFKTWRAFLFYAYFDELSFAALKSLKGSTARTDTNDPYGAPPCSPKSMYRLAEKAHPIPYDIPALKKRTVDDIRMQLSLRNILEEVFSSFATLHPEIQELELDYLYNNINDLTIQTELPKWIEAMEDGRLSKGASHTLSSLFTKLAMCSVPQPERPRNQPNLGSFGRWPGRGKCYGPHRAPRHIHTEPDGTQICAYCGGEIGHD
ncbi:hypothetical protein LXA43DRAFT_879627 [Ganoderma leucocontextum]|nr:hypothetical protein LXA43DRAFT_879627 [Ganoderma leucocontextum]